MSEDRALYAVTAALLAQGRSIDRLSSALTVGALGALAIAPATPGWPALALVVLAGLAGAWLGARVAFDAALFRALAEGQGLPDLGTMDRVLVGLGLMPAAKTGRPADQRAAGARRLLRLQAATLAMQLAAVLGAIALRG